ncbi:uncharacterized protein LOC143201436 isoform X2 [Rhynchophorus ferrugineus]|uniref:uncharacterized protein LOC143201436 isoform X2 n=1 Tax=Rhynchophorus ferrugineus TaxID=354439 RepID=UPI003FCC36D3
MTLEFILLAALIFIFMISFCGLLQKIKQTYDRERLIAEQLARRRGNERSQRSSDSSYGCGNDGLTNEEGVFPGGPPAYTEYYMEPPPKYDEVVKITVTDIVIAQQRPDSSIPPPNLPAAPPPYTITLTSTNETTNR